VAGGDAVTLRPTPADIPAIVAHLEGTAALLRLYGAGVLRASTLPPMGGGAGVHVSGGDISDPTAQSAVRNVDFGADNWLAIEQTHYRADLDAVVDACQALDSRTERVRQRLFPEARAVLNPDDLCEQGCGARKAKGRGDECEACYRWRHDHRDIDGMKPARVPTQVISDRNAVKARRVPAPGHVDAEAS
jgi:hypothetical protein